MEDSQGPVVSSEKDIHAYRCGDFASIVSSTPFLPLPSLDNITATSSWLSDNEIDTLKNTEKYLWGQMVVRRNRRMTKAIEALLKRPRNVTYFFALGAGEISTVKVCQCVSLCVYMYVYGQECVCTCMSVCVSVCLSVCMCWCVCVCVCVCGGGVGSSDYRKSTSSRVYSIITNR